MSFDNFATAARFRDLIRRIVRTEIERQRPRPQNAYVEEVNMDTRRAVLRYPGETETASVPFGIAVPVSGQTVRVDGPLGDRYISDVIGPW